MTHSFATHQSSGRTPTNFARLPGPPILFLYAALFLALAAGGGRSAQASPVSPLGRTVAPFMAAHPGKTGAYVLEKGEEGAAGASLAGKSRRHQHRRPVLYLEHGQHRHPGQRGAAAGRRAWGEGAGAGG